MEFIQRFLLYVAVAALLCLLMGLFRPWMMVWWEDIQNRKKVIKIYGTAAIISYALYWATFLINHMSKVIGVFIFLFLFFACTPKKEKKAEPVVQQANEYPALVLDFQNGEKVSAKDLTGDNVFVLFQPECEHCKVEAVQIEKRLEDFKDYTLYFISSSSMEAINSFAESFDLDNRENVKFARTSTEGVLTYYGPIPTPSVYIYSNGKLKASFKGQTEIDTILSAL